MDNANEGLVSGQPSVYSNDGDRKRTPNVPPCKPIFYHNLDEMPTQNSRKVVRRALYGWFALCFVFCYNFVAMTALNFTGVEKNGETESSGYTTSWFVSIVLLVAGIPVSFAIYMCLYSAARKTSSMYYCCFFPLFGGMTILFALFAIGVPDWGAGGLIELIVASGAGHPIVPAVMLVISFVLWLLTVAYSVYLLLLVRVEYGGAGGMAAARKEATSAGVKVAYDNRETIKEAAWEHREEIKQVAVDNKDLLIDVARENQDVAIGLAKENPDLAWQLAVSAAQDKPVASSKGAAAAATTPNVSLEDDINWSEFS